MENSGTSQKIVVEGYDKDGIELSAQSSKIVEEVNNHNIPSCAQSTYGPLVCHRWTSRFERAKLEQGEERLEKVSPCAPKLREYAAFNFQPSLHAETSMEGACLAITVLAQWLQNKAGP